MHWPERTPSDALPWLYVDLNSFFASVEQQLDPTLRGRPVIVVPVMSDATCAIAASYEAKALGIKTGTPVYEARKRCPGLAVVLAQHGAYVEVHHQVIAAMERCVPVYGVHSIDEFSAQLIGREAEAENALAIAREIKHAVAHDVGPHVRLSIGLGPNRLLAKIATDLQKPDGLTALPKASLPGRLFELALNDVPGIGQNMLRRLWAGGIYSMEDLWRTAPKQLRGIWGSATGERMWYLLHGEDLAAAADGPRKSIGHSHVLAPELRPQAEARLVGRRLLAKAASRLRRHGMLAGHLGLSVRLVSGGRCAAERVVEPSCDSFYLLGQLEVLWAEALHGHPQADCRKVSVTLGRLAMPGQVVGELFAGEASPLPQREKLSHAMDVLNQRFGRDTVSIGPSFKKVAGFGTKVAFDRIPEKAEFDE